MSISLPKAALDRKGIPIARGFIDYFPDAIAAVARLSQIGNDQHNPGTPLHWDRSKSGDEADCLMRHFIDRGTIDTDGVLHSTKVAWRALALLQKEIEGMLREDNDGRVPGPTAVSAAQQNGEAETGDTLVERPRDYVLGCTCPACAEYTAAAMVGRTRNAADASRFGSTLR